MMEDRVRAEGEQLITALAAAVQTRGLYPASHPEMHGAVVATLAAARRLVNETGDEAPPLFVTRRSFYLGIYLLPAASLRHPALRERFEEHGVSAVEIRPDIGEAAIATLTEMLTGNAPTTTATVGMDVNQVEPTFALQGTETLSALARAYDLGAEAMSQAAAAAMGGTSPEIAIATRAVEALVDEVTRDMSRAMLLAAIRAQNDDARRRAVDVAILSIALAHSLGISGPIVTQIGVGGLLHDVGMFAVGQEAVSTTGRLDDEQWAEISRHPIVGAGMLLRSEGGISHLAATVALEHHVGVDGSGYPPLPSERGPSVPARIVAVADGYVALTSPRPHRAPESRRQALATIAAESGTRYDPDVVDALLQLLGPYPVGSLVRLASGEIGVVIRPNPRLPRRPLVRVAWTADGRRRPTVDLDVAEFDGVDFTHDIDRVLPPDAVGDELAAVVEGPDVP